MWELLNDPSRKERCPHTESFPTEEGGRDSNLSPLTKGGSAERVEELDKGNSPLTPPHTCTEFCSCGDAIHKVKKEETVQRKSSFLLPTAEGRKERQNPLSAAGKSVCVLGEM